MLCWIARFRSLRSLKSFTAVAYKDAAAVIAGSTLEEHLRKLAQKNGVAIEKADGAPKKADALNADLAGAGAYNKLEQRASPRGSTCATAPPTASTTITTTGRWPPSSKVYATS
jgi:hypothetical protein